MTVAPHRPSIRPHRLERDFGLWVGGILVAIGAWWLYREKFPAARAVLLAVGGLLVLLGALWPRALAGPYRGWMAAAERFARVVTALILAIVYFLVVTPIGVAKRLRGWDPLERRRAASAGASYWRPYPARQHDPKHFDRMF